MSHLRAQLSSVNTSCHLVLSVPVPLPALRYQSAAASVAKKQDFFASLDETLLARAEAFAAVDIAVSQGKSHPFKPDATYHTMNSVPCSSNTTVPLGHHQHHQVLEPGDLLEHVTSPSLALMASTGHEGVRGGEGGGGAGVGGGGLISTSADPHSHMHGLSHLSHQAAMNMTSALQHPGLSPLVCSSAA
ncbi:POU domain, class 4, transcription factor 1-like [Xenopus laevis]|uniref:POU domain, class 4, transcription factor 1-like n=1 Tax=Xenopus laevis TaxID=8355 RepID=A0A8J1L270_XENLA|nr:POU domain, class 4, transcription factor 1-like [Xenopus laevis]